MSAATANFSRDPRARYEGSFDRWSYTSRSGWLILWHGSDQATYALGENQTVWIWEEAGRIWNRLPGDEANTVYREHELSMRRLRRAVLVVKLLNSKVPGERAAARSALQRIGSAVAEDWLIGKAARAFDRGFGWFDHPAAVYLAVTQDCRFHLRERERMPFDTAVFAELVAYAQGEFQAGRRAEPPRLRPVDLVYLQANVAASDRNADGDLPGAEPHPWQSHPPESEAPLRQAEVERIVNLRQAVADAVQAELTQEAVEHRKRRRFWLVSGLLAAGLVMAGLVMASGVMASGVIIAGIAGIF